MPQAGEVLRESLLAARERAAVTQTATRPEQYAENGRYLAAGGDSLAIYDLQDPLLQHPDFSLAAAIQGVAWSGDGKLAAWDERRLYVLVKDPVHRRWVSALSYRPRFTPRVIAPRGDTIGAVAWRPHADELAIVTTSSVYIWNLDANTLEKSAALLVTPDAAATGQPGAKWSQDGRELAAWNASLLLWDSDRPLRAAELLPVTSYVSVAEWTQDGRFVYGANGDPQLFVWEARRRTCAPSRSAPQGRRPRWTTGASSPGQSRGRSRSCFGTKMTAASHSIPLSGDPPTVLHPAQRSGARRGGGARRHEPAGVRRAVAGAPGVCRSPLPARSRPAILRLGTAQITDAWWLDSGSFIVRTLDGVLRGYTVDASDQLAQLYVLAGLPGDDEEELAVVRPLPEGRYADCHLPGR